MAACNNVSLIYDSECIGESLIKINTNFSRLDTALCQVGQDLIALNAFVKSLSAKDSPTIDMTFSAAGYFLKADVVNDSLGTVKLGVDIPTTTKQFLTGAKISSLIDTQISNPQSNELLVWNGTKWINKDVEDRVGAKFMTELGDVSFPTTLQNNQVLKYSSFYNKWVNSVDETELVNRDGNYVDITVSNNGKNWNINPGAVGTNELADGAVTTSKIALNSIVNNKIAENTIELDRCAFTVGEINTGKNLGIDGNGGYAICLETNIGTQIPIKRLKPAGAVSISDNGNTLTINVPTASAPIGASGTNLGTGVGIYNETTSTNGYLKFKKLKAGTGITLTSTSDEITIAAAPLTLGLSLIGVTATGTAITDNTEIATRIQAIYSASSFPDNTICRVEVSVPENDPINNVTVSVPYTIQYQRTGNTTNSTNFTLLDPPATEGINPNGKGNDIWTGSKTLSGTATLQNQPTFKVPTRQIKEFKVLSGLWVFVTNLT